MKKLKLSFVVCCLLICFFQIACSDNDESGTQRAAFDPNQPIMIDDFYPDSGGIATPMIISGKNFGSDTTGLRVYFVDENNVKHQGGLVSSNGNRLYVYVPEGLTYMRNINIQVERKLKDREEPFVGLANNAFIYKTQTSVTTIVGQVSNTDQPTKGGTLTTATLSAPVYICLDDEDNIFISERSIFNQGVCDMRCHKSDGENSTGNILKASITKGDVVVLSENQYGNPNSPIFYDEPGLETVYVPADGGMEYYQMAKTTGYLPRRLLALKNTEYPEIDKDNWKYSFVVNKNDKQLYTVMWRGQLVRINPKTRLSQVLLKKVGIHGGSDSFCAFSPIEPNKLFICFSDNNEIWTVDLDDLKGKDIEEYHGEPYAGRACWEGKTPGTGWEDGLLRNAKFNNPREISFTSDGKLYIADAVNCCIRTIDTTVPQNRATVSTAIGLPGTPGHQDGGPDIAKFHYPFGVAVSKDGTHIYVADTHNRVIRKLSIQ